MAQERVERRLAAILVSDMVGYSRLMEANEAGTIARQKMHRKELIDPTITEHNGRIVKTTGDGLMIEFGSAVDAVEYAVASQLALAGREAGVPEDRRIRYRVGINVGDIVIDGDDILGDGVNVAARLEGLAEPGGICVSGSVHEQVVGKTDLAFVDMGEQKVKNIKKPIKAYAVRLDPGEQGTESAATSAPQALELPDKPSIAVIPFDNMSGDQEQEYFADGITEDVITLLSTVPDLFVIARNSTFTYKGKAVKVQQVAEELGVRYVLEGSVRKAGNRIRVTAQFIDAKTGTHIWADRFDRDLEDIFAVQDEITQGIVGALQSRLIVAEVDYMKRKPPEALDAWGNIVNAKIKLFAFRQADIAAAEPFARRALEIDSDYAEGHAVLGHILGWKTYNGWTDEFKKTARDALEHCEAALRLDPNHPDVLVQVGFSMWWLGRHDQGIPHLRRAAVLNPNSPVTAAMHGYSLSAQGQHEEGIRSCEKAFRLSPSDPLEYLFLNLLGAAQLYAKKYVDAKANLERSLEIMPDMTLALTMLACVCVRLDRFDEAKEALDRVAAISDTAIPFLFRVRSNLVNWQEYTDPIREIYSGPLPEPAER